MPAFTSTTVSTLFRKVASAARYVQPGMKVVSARPLAPRRAINTLQRTRNAVKQIIHQTFPSTSLPSHQLGVGKSVQAASRGFSHNAPRRPLGPVGRAVHASTRPKFTGASIQANVGLGSARTFASGPAHSVHAKVPMTLRAFASLLDDERDHKALPRATRYSPYTRSKPLRSRQCRSNQESYRHYFQSPIAVVTLPPTPETLVTPGDTTVLALPLSPSLDALLVPTPRVTYAETSIGVDIFARLVQGFLPIHEAFSNHSSTRINPLLYKLDSLGVLDQDTTAEVVCDAEGRPDILRLVFNDRSVADVKTLLGDSLRKGEDGEWWALFQAESAESGHSKTDRMELSVAERQDLMEDWTGQSTAIPSSPPTLVFPTLDMSAVDVSAVDIHQHDQSPISWPSSGSSTPLSPDLDPSPTSSIFIESLTASLLSEMSESSEVLWEISPSDADSDVETAEGESWGEVSVVEETSSPSVLGRWSGSGQGFGFTQAW